MFRKMLEINEYTLNKQMVKVSGCEIRPHFKQDASGEWIPDDSISAVTIRNDNDKEIANFSVKINFTGTQRLNLFGQTEQPQKTLPVKITVFNSFGVGTVRNLKAGDCVDMLLSGLTYSSEYGYQAVAQWISKSELKKDSYNMEWSQTFLENSLGKNLVTVSHQKLFQKRIKDENGVLKDENGKSIIDESAPILTEKSFLREDCEPIFYGNFAISTSIHKKTAKAVLNRDQKEDYDLYMIFISVFGNLYNRMKTLNETDKLKTHFNMDMLVSTNDEFNNATLLSLWFTPKKTENNSTEIPESKNETTESKTPVSNPEFETEDNSDIPGFPPIKTENESLKNATNNEVSMSDNLNLAANNTKTVGEGDFPEWMMS